MDRWPERVGACSFPRHLSSAGCRTFCSPQLLCLPGLWVCAGGGDLRSKCSSARPKSPCCQQVLDPCAAHARAEI